MALYHFTAKAVSRGKGQSAVHTAAYNAREQLHDERENRDTKDYGYKGKTEFSGIFAPKDAPSWAHDREQLWNRVEAAEHRKDSQTARNVEFALPHELTAEQRRHLVTDFVRETFARRGMIADVNIHEPHQKNDDRNYHVHCLLTMRRLDGENFAAKKETLWNKKSELAEWREKWAHMGARALERAGFQQEANRFRNGHKLMADQMKAALAIGDREWAEHCDKEAQIHKGAAVSAMEQKNDPRLADNEIAREAKAIDDRNAARAEIKALEKELAALEQKEADQAKVAPEIAKPQPVTPEPEKPAHQPAKSWHDRPATPMEEQIFHLQYAAEHGGQHLGAALSQQGLALARVDAKGIERVNAEYRAEFETARADGDVNAVLLKTQVRVGELVAIERKSGDIYRLNPRYLDLDKLLSSATGGTKNVPALSAAKEFFVDRYRQKDQTRETQTYQERARLRDALPMEKRLAELLHNDRVNGVPLAAALKEDKIVLARADAKGMAELAAEYGRKFGHEQSRGTPHEYEREANLKDGQLVAVTRNGQVHRIQDSFVDLAELEKRATGGDTMQLSEARALFAADRQQKKDDRAAAQHTKYDTREATRQQNNLAHDVKQGAQTVLGAATGKDTALKVMTGAGVKLLEDFVAALFSGTGDRPPPTSEQRAQQRALIALERIADSFAAGENLTASDVANLLPTQLDNLKLHGDDYMREIISDFEQYRKAERERENERGLER